MITVLITRTNHKIELDWLGLKTIVFVPLVYFHKWNTLKEISSRNIANQRRSVATFNTLTVKQLMGGNWLFVILPVCVFFWFSVVRWLFSQMYFLMHFSSRWKHRERWVMWLHTHWSREAACHVLQTQYNTRDNKNKIKTKCRWKDTVV